MCKGVHLNYSIGWFGEFESCCCIYICHGNVNPASENTVNFSNNKSMVQFIHTVIFLSLQQKEKELLEKQFMIK